MSVELEPKKIFVNGRTLVVLWDDGTRTQTTCSTMDEFDPEVGFAVCLMKKLYGKKIHGKKLYQRMIRRAYVQEVERDVRLSMSYWLEKVFGNLQMPHSQDI